MNDTLVPSPTDPAPLSATSEDHLTTSAVRDAQVDTHIQEDVIADYRSRLAQKTRLRHDTDLRIFVNFLTTGGGTTLVDTPDVLILSSNVTVWAGVTAELLTDFRMWMLQQGYSIGTIYLCLSTIRIYAHLAHQAGIISADGYSFIKEATSNRRGEGDRLDQHRQATGQSTRKSTKKASAHLLTSAQIAELKQAAILSPTIRTTAVHARDALIICLLVDVGLRCGEVALLRWESLCEDLLVVGRPKVKMVQRHRLLGDTLAVLTFYRANVPTPIDLTQPLLAAFNQNGTLVGFGLSERAICKRIQQLGILIGIPNLSPQDLRHSWATRLMHAEVSIQTLRDVGDWANFTAPARYVSEPTIANKHILLGPDLVWDTDLE